MSKNERLRKACDYVVEQYFDNVPVIKGVEKARVKFGLDKKSLNDYLFARW